MAISENDIYRNITQGNLYMKGNIKCTFTDVLDYNYISPENQQYHLSQGTIKVNCYLHGVTGEYEHCGYFKDGSYIKIVLNETWNSSLNVLSALQATAIFGLKDPDTEQITEQRFWGPISGFAEVSRHYWIYVSNPPLQDHWEIDHEIVFQPGDQFAYYLGWWNTATPKLRHFFINETAGGGEYTAALFYTMLNPNILTSGVQTGFDVAGFQDIAAYLANDEISPAAEYPGDPSGTGGGNGTFLNRNDNVGFPAVPSLQAIDLGFTSLYNPSPADVQAFAAWLWTDNFTENIKMNYSDPLNNILGMNFIPLPEGMINTELSNFVVGNCDSGIQTSKVVSGNKNQYVDLDCGSVILPEKWQNFLDYNSSFQIWLPFIGFRQLRPDDILQATEDSGGSLKVHYIIDLLTGCAVCNIVSVLVDRQTDALVEHLLYSYNCNCFYSTPLSGANFMSQYNQQLSATASGISNLVSSVGQMASGNIAGAVSGLTNLLLGQQQAKREYETAKPDYGRAGNSGGSSGYFSYKKPYIVKSNPISQVPDNYSNLEGIPAMIYRKLSKLSGYTEINAINLDSINASSAEKSELMNIMKSGFYI